MPTIRAGNSVISYEESGSGFPMLCIAPGGMDSSIAKWANATINPLTAFASDYRIIAMDQRNAGDSKGPFPTDDPWSAYLGDQLALMDALGYSSFHVFGCCIGGPYALKLAHAVPDRMGAVVLEQPMGLVPENQSGWIERCHDWSDHLASIRDDLGAQDGHRCVDLMWQQDFVASLTREEVSEIASPVCVLPGIDAMHPTRIGEEIAALVLDGIVVSPWKDSPEHADKATARVRAFLEAHTPMIPTADGGSVQRPPRSLRETADAQDDQ